MPDRVQQALGVVLGTLTAPLLGVLAALVRIDSPGPAVYRAIRVGDGGRVFTCYKLRTMAWRPGPEDVAVTHRYDPRITRLGAILRGLRLDELPQLWNVAAGQMRLVGPRPEAPRFVDMTLADHRVVFTTKPGITGLAQLVFADEAALLDSQEPETVYREQVLPIKVRYDLAYIRERSPWLDVWILAQTPRAILGRGVILPEHIRRAVEAGTGEGQPADPRGEHR